MLDLSAAFDTVDHWILLNRLRDRFGIQGVAHRWFTSYLTDRTQFVSVEGKRSTSRPLICGVPQGSVLGPLLYSLYTTAIGDIMRHHIVSFHQYADDTQIYCSFKLSDSGDFEQTKLRLQSCVNDIYAWMVHNNLQLNDDKTKILVFHAKHRPPPPLKSLQVATACVKPSDHARNIGVIFDSNLSLDRQISTIGKSAFYSIRSISTIRKFLSLETAKSLIHAFVTSKLDNCNALLYGLQKYQSQRLQYVLNSAARLVKLFRKHEHISPVLMELHWLPVEQRVEFKMLLYVFKVVNDVAPSYLQDLLELYRPTRSLRSRNKKLLKTRSYKLKSYGYRAFSVCAPQLWNALPLELKESESVIGFKKALKTYLFRKAYFK